MDILNILQLILTVIGAASVVLKIIAPLTKTKKDDKVVAFLEKLLKNVSLDSEQGKLTIDIKKK